jgi:hypothetical protein
LSKQTRIRGKGGVTGLRKPDGEILNAVFQMQGSNPPNLDLSFVRYSQRPGKLKVWAGTLKQAPPGQDMVVFMYFAVFSPIEHVVFHFKLPGDQRMMVMG